MGTNPITLLEINSTFQSWPNTNITRTSNRCVSLELKNISDKCLNLMCSGSE